MGVFDTQRANKNHFAIKYVDDTKTKTKIKNKTIEQTRLMKIIKINQIHQNASPKIYVIQYNFIIHLTFAFILYIFYTLIFICTIYIIK